MGVPTGIEDSLKILVPPPLWQTPLFWPALLVIVGGAAIGMGRYVAWYRMRREVQRLQQQRALEQERLRIAQDIHDDLGARVTQISLLSAMAQNNATLPEQARNDFDTISRLTRELVSALYETVWAVNPENDNLDALGNYLCQMINQLCEKARLRCRLDVALLPKTIAVSSQTRHNIIMAVKEAANNIIKHAKAAEVTLRVTFHENNLSISVSDDGCGFDPNQHSNGNGLMNLKRRLADIGGNCSIQSQPGKGTTVSLQLIIKSIA
jgi:signal transduction histidine kinase